MEIIIALVIIGVGLIWYYNNKAAEKQIVDTKKENQAPYKVEPPETSANVKEVVAEAAVGTVKVEASVQKPAKTKKAPAKKPAKPKAEKPKAEKPAAPKKPKAKKAS